MRAKQLKETVYQINKKGNIVAIIKDNIGLAKADVTYQQIYRCLTKSRDTYKGYRWCFKEDIEETINKTKKEKILCLDNYGNIVKDYRILKDVIYDGFFESGVCECLKNKKIQHKKHYWCYEKDYSIKLEEINKRIVEQYQDGELIQRYGSNNEIIEAGYTLSSVYQCLNKKSNTHCGCTWRYAS